MEKGLYAMNNVLSKTLRGFLSGVAVGAAIYLVCFLIELFTFFKQYFSDSNYVVDSNGIATNVGSLSLSDYVPLLSVWNWFFALFVFGSACVIGTIIGLVVGCIQNTDKKKKSREYNSSVLEDGSGRQKIVFARNIKTMAESLKSFCGETLHYMNNFVSSDYSSAEENNAIMTELVKFVDYEQAIKECINNKKGGR